MEEKGGFITIYRRLLEWEWYGDINVKTLFLHCLLKANWKDKNWQGKVIPRGSFVTSTAQLAMETKLTVREIRTSLTKLFSTGELTKVATSKYTIINVVNYGLYQCSNDTERQGERQGERQTSDKRTTNERQQLNKIINKQDNKKNDNDYDNSADTLCFDDHHFFTKKLLNENFISFDEELFGYDSLFEELLKVEEFVDVAKAVEYVKSKMRDKTFKNKFGYFKTAMSNQLSYIPEDETVQEQTRVVEVEDISDEELRKLLESV